MRNQNAMQFSVSFFKRQSSKDSRFNDILLFIRYLWAMELNILTLFVFYNRQLISVIDQTVNQRFCYAKFVTFIFSILVSCLSSFLQAFDYFSYTKMILRIKFVLTDFIIAIHLKRFATILLWGCLKLWAKYR